MPKIFLEPVPTMTAAQSLQQFKKTLEDLQIPSEMNDEYLLRFLRAKKFHIPEAVKLYKSASDWKDTNRNVLKIPFGDCISIFRRKHFTVFREKDNLGRPILYIRAEQWEPKETTVEMAVLTLFLYIEETQRIEENQLNGIVVIFDMNAMTVTHAAQMLPHFTLKIVKTLIGFLAGGSPVKLKSVHVLNAPFLVASFYAGVKYLLKRKLRNRIHLHYGGYEKLHRDIGKDYLPKFLGGNIPDKIAEDTELVKSIFNNHNTKYPFE